MTLGDILAENFRLKAVGIRLNMGLAALCVWLLNAAFALFARIYFGVWILKKLNAPTFVWWLWGLSIPCGLIGEQIETKSKERNS
jgi:hypothetical protein